MRFSAIIFTIAAIALGSNAAAITKRDTDNTAFTCPSQQNEALCCISEADDNGDVNKCDYATPVDANAVRAESCAALGSNYGFSYCCEESATEDDGYVSGSGCDDASLISGVST